MDNITTIYKILKMLETSMDYPAFNCDYFTPEHFHLSEERFYSLIRMLVNEGLIEGVQVETDAAGNFNVSISRPRLTLKGLEYLNDNSLMQRAMRTAKGIKDIIPFV